MEFPTRFIFPGMWAIISCLAPQPARALTIVYSNDVMGELEPCGCRHNPTGGLDRKETFLARLKDKELVQIDSGNLLFETTEVPEALARQSELQAQYLLRGYEQLKHDLVTPGLKDFALGATVFKRLIARTKTQFISANLFDRKTGHRLLEPSLILTRKDAKGVALRLAFIGIASPGEDWARHGIEARDPALIIQAELSRLKGKYDRVFLLSQLGQTEDEALAERLPVFDGIFGARSQSLLQTPVQIGKTFIYQASFRNQYIGSVNLDTLVHQLTPLDPGFIPATETPVKKLIGEFKAKIAKQNRTEVSLARAEKVPGDEIHQTFPRCAECHLKQFDFWRKTRHTLALKSLIDSKQSENKDCLRCHTVGLGEKGGFSAVTQLGRLRGGGEWPPEDLSAFLAQMHAAPSLSTEVTLRRGDASGFPLKDSLAKADRAYSPVQCENCHGPGGEHPFGSTTFKKAVPDSRCLKCHTAERAPQWYGSDGKLDAELLKKNRLKVTCPRGELD